MNEKLKHLAAQLTEALAEFNKLEMIIAETCGRVANIEPTMYDLLAVGGVLHNLYQGMENILKRVVRELDSHNPLSGGGWHRELVEVAAQEIPGVRPAILRPETRDAALLYLAFRHIFRNLYGFELEWSRMKPLLDNAPAMREQFSTDIEQFITFLSMMANIAE